jgi:peroxiredoxin-like protein
MSNPPYYYEAEVEWTGQRSGQLRSRSLLSLDVAAPPEFKGEEGKWTPEHLFVSSVAACFMTTFAAIAELSKLAYVSFRCTAIGKLEKLEGAGYQITGITLKPRLVIPESSDRERALRILQKAEKSCLISNSIKSEVTLEPTIVSFAVAEQSA